MRNLINSIIEKHQKGDGIEINKPAPYDDIQGFEEEIGFNLPKEFKEFYLISDGFYCNEDLFQMIPLADITESNQNFGENWFYFSEYIIYSDVWGLRYTKSGKYEIFNGSYSDKKMTSSLVKFLENFFEGNVFDYGGLYDWQEELGIK